MDWDNLLEWCSFFSFNRKLHGSNLFEVGQFLLPYLTKKLMYFLSSNRTKKLIYFYLLQPHKKVTVFRLGQPRRKGRRPVDGGYFAALDPGGENGEVKERALHQN